MTRLELRLVHPSMRIPLPMGAVAKLRWIGRLDGSPPKEWWEQEKAIGISASNAIPFDLPDGGYFSVDILRPRGAIISVEFKVEAGETRTESIDLGASPHEYLSWQQAAGIVPRKLDALSSQSIQLPRAVKGWVGGRLASLEVSACLLVPIDLGSGAMTWQNAAEGIARAPEARAMVTSAPVNGETWNAQTQRQFSEDDGRYVTWDLDQQDFAAARNAVHRTTSPGRSVAESSEPPIPRWFHVAVDGVVDIVSMPWPWWQLPPENWPTDRKPFQILHDRIVNLGGVEEPRARTVVTVRDERWFPLLEFLASGRLAEAGAIVGGVLNDDELIGAVERKFKGPLLAVAGAIVLIARSAGGGRQRWDPWICNLAKYFPQMPDGEILLGCRLLQLAADPAARQNAFAHLLAGFHRGIPFMAATISMLSLALAQLGGEIEGAETIRRQVVGVSSRLDPDQPFVVIRQ